MPSRFSSNDEVVISQQSGCTHLTIETNSSNSLYLSANGRIYFQTTPSIGFLPPPIEANNNIRFNKISSNGLVIGHLSSSNSLQTVVTQANSVSIQNPTNPGKVGGYRYIKTFTSNTTWTIPKGVTRVRFVAVGGGGGGGAVGTIDDGTGVQQASAGISGGGGGGATAVKHYEGSNIAGQQVTITVGRGGRGGVGWLDALANPEGGLLTPVYETTSYGVATVEYAADGLDGDETIVTIGSNTIVKASGGRGGTGAGFEGTVTVSGGAGGRSGANADFYIPGANGQQGQQMSAGSTTSYNQIMFMGIGGGSSLGYVNTSLGVTAGQSLNPFSGLRPYGYGAGGSGINLVGGGAGYFGLSGTDGIVVVEFG